MAAGSLPSSWQVGRNRSASHEVRKKQPSRRDEPGLTAVTFSLFGFLIGLWADGFEKLQLVPMLIVTPLSGSR